MPSQSKSSAISLFILASLPLINAFGTIGSNYRVGSKLVTPSTLPKAPTSPLFVANASQTNDGESPVIKNIEAEMQKAQRKREKYKEKLENFDQKLVALERKKNEYLQGTQLGKVENNFTETTARSAVKAFMWRVIAGTVTLITSLKVSGSLAVALKIVGSDFFSKAFTMFVGERIMNKSQAGRKAGADSAGRSVAKALIWRLFAICNTMIAAFFFAGDIKMASKIAGSDAIFKTALMVAYERVWARIEWGKEYMVDFSI